MNPNTLYSGILVLIGRIIMLVGALDPIEGSLAILLGSGLVALGTFLGKSERRLIAYRAWAFILIAIGVGAMWAMTMMGGIGGNSGYSIWWGVLVLPYLFGWSMGIWGPGSPRWLLVLGIVVGLWYQVILAMVLMRTSLQHGWGAIVFSALGVLTIIGCVSRLRNQTTERQ